MTGTRPDQNGMRRAGAGLPGLRERRTIAPGGPSMLRVWTPASSDTDRRGRVSRYPTPSGGTPGARVQLVSGRSERTPWPARSPRRAGENDA